MGHTVRAPQRPGVRLSMDGQASAWATLPRDGMGPVLDETDLPGQIAGLLRLVGQLRVVESPQVAVAGGIDPTVMLSIGRVAQLPRSSATMPWVSDQPLRMAPDESVTLGALDAGALEVSRALSRTLLETFVGRR